MRWPELLGFAPVWAETGIEVTDRAPLGPGEVYLRGADLSVRGELRLSERREQLFAGWQRPEAIARVGSWPDRGLRELA